MKTHFENEVKNLNRLMLAQALAVESAVSNSLRAIADRNSELAVDIISRDDIIDKGEVLLEEECLKVLALHQPVASDLRLIITILKVNSELERIGDLAVNIAERALHIIDLTTPGEQPNFTEMNQAVLSMLKRALDSFLTQDCFLASQTIDADSEVDRMHRENFLKTIELTQQNPSNAALYVDCLNVSRNLERIADSCTNISEDVLYFLQGKIVRHSR